MRKLINASAQSPAIDAEEEPLDSAFHASGRRVTSPNDIREEPILVFRRP